MPNHQIVSQMEWLQARKHLLQQEMQLAEEQERITQARAGMPWVKVNKNYNFEGNTGTLSLSDLFGQKSQLIIYHFMFSQDWDEGSFLSAFDADNFDEIIIHLNSRDIAFAVVSKAEFNKLSRYEQRMRWHFTWVSSLNSDFTEDFHVSFMRWQQENFNSTDSSAQADQAPGISVFCKDDNGDIYHTYSGFAKGMAMLNSAYHYMDLTPKGRDSYGLFND